jgi:ABC-2 type transport system permease protein
VTTLTAERIKLFSTRSTWWCSAGALALTLAVAAVYGVSQIDGPGLGISDVAELAKVNATRVGVMLVMTTAVIAVTGEYRHSLIRMTFLATPDRTAVMLGKAAVVVALSTVVGLLITASTWGVLALQGPGPKMGALDGDVVRVLLGSGLVYALAAVFALAVGMAIRHTTGAVVLVILWPLIGEQLPVLLNFLAEGVGNAVVPWMPFMSMNRFLAAGVTTGPGGVWGDVSAPLGPWLSLLYAAAVIGLLYAGAVWLVNRRDA